MSLELAAETLAHHIASLDYIEIYSHHDADGIAAAAIMSIALSRENIAFKLRIRSRISESDIENQEISLLCDFGAAFTNLAKNVMVIDHHIPHNTSPYHVNPHLFYEDGETEFSGAGCAYLVANALGDNRDLAGLVMIGIIGDNQTISGRNQTIINDAIANNLINPHRRVLLTGRTIKEQIVNSLNPYIPDLSGNEEKSAAIESLCMSKISDEARISCMLSQIVLSSDAPYSTMMNLYGDSWNLERETIQNAHTLTAVVDACGKAGKAEIAYALCCGDISYLDEAWEIAASYRNRVISSVKSAEKINNAPAIWRVSDCATVGDVADILIESTNGPTFVLCHDGGSLIVSARVPKESLINLEQTLKKTAELCGGSGEGHRCRAGAYIPLDHEDKFLSCLEAIPYT